MPEVYPSRLLVDNASEAPFKGFSLSTYRDEHGQRTILTGLPDGKPISGYTVCGILQSGEQVTLIDCEQLDLANKFYTQFCKSL